MVESTWKWANQKPEERLKVNEVHGEEEVKIVLREKFDFKVEEREEVERSGTLEVEARFQRAFKLHVPRMKLAPSSRLTFLTLWAVEVRDLGPLRPRWATQSR